MLFKKNAYFHVKRTDLARNAAELPALPEPAMLAGVVDIQFPEAALAERFGRLNAEIAALKNALVANENLLKDNKNTKEAHLTFFALYRESTLLAIDFASKLCKYDKRALNPSLTAQAIARREKPVALMVSLAAQEIALLEQSVALMRASVENPTASHQPQIEELNKNLNKYVTDFKEHPTITEMARYKKCAIICAVLLACLLVAAVILSVFAPAICGVLLMLAVGVSSLVLACCALTKALFYFDLKKQPIIKDAFSNKKHLSTFFHAAQSAEKELRGETVNRHAVHLFS